MKRFEIDKELDSMKNKNSIAVNDSKLGNMFVPLLVIACSALAMTGVAFSANLVDKKQEVFDVSVKLVNASGNTIQRSFKSGPVNISVNSHNAFESLECSSGDLYFDPESSTLRTPNIESDTKCVLKFKDRVDAIDYDKLLASNDLGGVSYYFKGNATNNYFKYGTFMFRILRINSDGSYRLVLNDSLLSGTANTQPYENSNIRTVLNNWFNANLANDKNILNSEYAINKIGNPEEIIDFINLEDNYYDKVGTVSLNEVYLVNKDVTDSYLDSDLGIYTSNTNYDDNYYAYSNNKIVTVKPNTNLEIKPVINVKGTLDGDGTMQNPFTLKK